MYPYTKKILVDEFGNPIGEIYDNGDGPGILAIMAGMVLMGISYALSAVYEWMLSHYLLIGCLSFFGLITLVGWAKVRSEIGDLTKLRQIVRGFIVLLMVLFGFNTMLKGFSKDNSEDSLKKEIQGQWVNMTNTLEFNIMSNTLDYKSLDNVDRISTKYSAQYVAPEIVLNCFGKSYVKDKTGKLVIDSVKISYYCLVKGDTLRITDSPNSSQYEIFLRK